MVDTLNTKRSRLNGQLFNEAKRYITGGVNSPVRSFKSVGGIPVFINRAGGSKIYDEAGKEYIDYCLSWGALILGHSYSELIRSVEKALRKGTSFGANTKLETKLAKLIVESIPSIEQVRLTNSGTEAVMSAVRLARAYTGKKKIIKFEGSYHGHVDYLLVKAGSGAAALGIPDSLGVPRDFTKHTIVVPFNNIRQIETTVKRHKKDLAAIIIEPVLANCGVILPQIGFLRALRNIADIYNIVLIFDEIVTGFRLAYSGAQNFFGVMPDMTCFGKIIGGGFPIGGFGGKKEIMRLLAPLGGVYQAGTLSGNPVAVTAGIFTLERLKQKNIYKNLEEKTKKLCEEIKRKAEEYKIEIKVNYIGSMFSIFFSNEDVVDYKTARKQDFDLFNKFFHSLLRQGIYFSPSGFETNFLSAMHTAEDVEKTLKIIDKAFSNLRRI